VTGITWTKPAGAEFATVEIGGGSLWAYGVAVGAGPLPYHLDYRLVCEDRFATRRLSVRASGEGWSRGLDLSRDAGGGWRVVARADGEADLPPPGGDTAALAGSLDCDLGECPLTNTMPVLRHGLLAGGEPREFTMAWVSVPDLSLHPSVQTYTFVRRTSAQPPGAVINFSAGDFTADIVFDAAGLVVDYPGLASRA
jgi:uncharacterized protein